MQHASTSHVEIFEAVADLIEETRTRGLLQTHEILIVALAILGQEARDFSLEHLEKSFKAELQKASGYDEDMRDLIYLKILEEAQPKQPQAKLSLVK